MKHVLNPEYFKRLIDFTYEAYQENSKADTLRQKGKTPFITHPLFAASLLLADRQIPYKERVIGYQVLILHDVLEDTNLELPEWIDENVRKRVEEMTYKNDVEAYLVMSKKGPFGKLLSLCDMLSNMYEDHVRKYKRRRWRKAIEELTEDVKKYYGNTRIIQISKAILQNTSW